MKPIGYNPCSDGFPAKVWECLRRNKKFRDEVESILDTEKSEDDKHWPGVGYGMEAETRLNYAAAAVFDQITEIDINSPWPNLPAKFRSSFEKLFSDQRDLPNHGYQPQFLGAMPTPFALNKELDYEDPKSSMDRLKYFSETHIFVAVPKHIRDKNHKDVILESINHILPSPALKKSIMNQRGTILGSKRAWDAFLVFEFLESKIPSRKKRLGICKMHSSDPHTYNLAAKTDFSALQPHVSKDLDDAITRRSASIGKDYIKPIEDGIKLTYPIFQVFKQKA